MIHNSKIKIAVALSGGVDSAVAAKILKDEGCQLVGFFLKLWSDPTSFGFDSNPTGSQSNRHYAGQVPNCSIKENRCCNYEALEDARSVAAKLDIPFYVIDAKDGFKKNVVDYFLREYKSLRTPNPCVVCNEKIKFDLLLKRALEIGCDYLATGHYARILETEELKNLRTNEQKNGSDVIASSNLRSNLYNKEIALPSHPISPKLRGAGKGEWLAMTKNNGTMKQCNNIFRLLAGLDSSKDQSYNLYRLNQDQLAHIIFPLGEMTKREVRALADQWDLPVKEKPESQEICFFGDGDYRHFLRRYLPAKYFKAGDIVDKKGDIVGRHEGLVNYTVGQRRGINQQNPNLKILNSKQIQNAKPKIKNDRHSRPDRESTNKSPLYVVGFDVKKNQLIVGKNEDVFQKSMMVSDLHWVDPNSTCYPEGAPYPRGWLLTTGLNVKIRSQAKAVECRIMNYESRIKNHEVTIEQLSNLQVVFSEKQRAVTPGQSAVFYVGDEVIGGGIISS